LLPLPPTDEPTNTDAGFAGSLTRSMCNLANIDAAMHGRLLEVIEARLLAVGAGPILDFADATAFLAAFEPIIEKAPPAPACRPDGATASR
jgi:hypothetical protein